MLACLSLFLGVELLMMKPVLSVIAHNQRWKAIRPYLRGRVLDVGCGWASIPDLLAPGQQYVGVDGNPTMIAYGQKKYPQHRFFTRNVDTQPLALSEACFDTVILSAVIEHLQQPERILHEIRQVLAPQGNLLITTPTPWGDFLHHLGSLLRLFYAESVLGHVKVFNQKSLRDIAEQCGFEVVEYRTFALGANQVAVCKGK